MADNILHGTVDRMTMTNIQGMDIGDSVVGEAHTLLS